ncbi:MAG: HAD family phosphatase [Kiritimatiellia bacterium]
MKWSFIFDIGGVLLDFDLARLVVLASRGDEPCARALLGLRDHPSLREVESGFITGKEYHARFIRPAVPHWTFRDLVEGWKTVFSENSEGLALVRHVRARGASVYLLSNLADYNKIAIEEQFPNFFGLSDGNFLSYELGCIKPDPVIFNRVLTAIGSPPGRCVFLDDTPGHVAAARALGIHGFVFEKGKSRDMKRQLDALMASDTSE